MNIMAAIPSISMIQVAGSGTVVAAAQPHGVARRRRLLALPDRREGKIDRARIVTVATWRNVEFGSG